MLSWWSHDVDDDDCGSFSLGKYYGNGQVFTGVGTRNQRPSLPGGTREPVRGRCVRSGVRTTTRVHQHVEEEDTVELGSALGNDA